MSAVRGMTASGFGRKNTWQNSKKVFLKTWSPFWEGKGIQTTHRLFRKMAFLASAVPPGHEDHSVCQLCDPPRPKYKVAVE